MSMSISIKHSELIESIFNLTAGLKWNFANDKLSLSARCNDIFDTGMPATKVRFKGQHLDMNSGFYSRSFNYFVFPIFANPFA